MTNFIVVVGSIMTFLTALTALVTQLVVLRTVRRNDQKTDEIKHKTEEIKHLVNSAADASKAYNLLLSDELRAVGHDVPVDPSIKPPERSGNRT